MKRDFKVGDRVRVYGAFYNGTLEPFVAPIEHIYQNGSITVSHDEIVFCAIHPKQCRLLVKKERRRIWVNEYQDGDLRCWNTRERADSASGNWRIRCSEFVEVRCKGEHK